MPLIPDIRISVQNQSQLILDPVVKNGQFQRSRNGQLLMYAGGFTAVFPVIINGEKWAFRCWHVPITDASKRLKLVSEFILKNTPSYLVPLKYTTNGIIVKGEIFPTTRMKWIEGKIIKKYLCESIGKKEFLLAIASSFLSLIEDMHRLGIAHGDLQHGNILVTEKGNLYLVDYDSMYVPSMGDDYNDEIVGKDDYQHPNRRNNRTSNRKVDYFSELIIYLSIIALAENAHLATKYRLADTEFLLFSAADFKDLKRSSIYMDLQSLDIPLINHLLDILIQYLKADDICKLEPFSDDAKFKTLLSSYFQSEDDLWAEVQAVDSIKAYQNYLKKYPRGRFNIVARRKLNILIEERNNKEEEDLWRNAKREGTLASFSHYLAYSVKRTHLSEAKSMIEELRWDLAVSLNTVQAYQEYVNETDLGLHRDEANIKIDELSWNRACRLRTEKAYRYYLYNSIPKIHKSEAYQAIDDIFWRNAETKDTVEGYNDFLNKSLTLTRESGLFITDNRFLAVRRLGELEEQLWDKVSTEDQIVGYESYLSKFPSGRYTNECSMRLTALRENEKDEEAWQKAQKADSLAEYKNYLFSFPEGYHLQQCKNKIESIEFNANFKKTFKWILILAIFVSIVVVAIRLSGCDERPSGETTLPVRTESTSPINVSIIEDEVFRIIKGAERAKDNGDPINYSRLQEAEALLNQMKNSPKYIEYRQRLNALKL